MSPEDPLPWQLSEKALWMLAEYESEARREAKKMWWKSFDFHPGAALECRFSLETDSAEWYPVFVLDTLEELPKDTSKLEFDPRLFKPDIGMVLVHYVGGRSDEDEWIPKDSDRLRLDKYLQRMEAQHAVWTQHYQRTLEQISDPAQRKARAKELKVERQKHESSTRMSREEKAEEREKNRELKAQAKIERLKNREMEKSERERLRQELKQERIANRQKEQERKRLESKKAKELERERQRIMQNKASWWKEFDWVVGVMVEMEWEGDWWDAIVVKTIDCPDGKGGRKSSHGLLGTAKDGNSDGNCMLIGSDGRMGDGGAVSDDLPMFSAGGDLPMFGVVQGDEAAMALDGAEGYYDTYTGVEEEGAKKKGEPKKGFKRTPTTILEVRVNRVSKQILIKFLDSMMALKEAESFLTPVSHEVAPDYEKVVKRPMDFGSVKVKLSDDKYGTPKTFLSDCRLVFDNAKLYNKEGDDVYKSALAFEDKFDAAWRGVEKELERLAEERNTLIVKADSNPDIDPKAWLKQVEVLGKQASPAKDGGRSPTPPPPPPPNAQPGSPPPPPPPAPPQPQEQEQPYAGVDYEMEGEQEEEMGSVCDVPLTGPDAMVVEQLEMQQSMPSITQVPDDAQNSRIDGASVGAEEAGAALAPAAGAEEGHRLASVGLISMPAQTNPLPVIDSDTDPKAWLQGQAGLLSAETSPHKGSALGGLDKQDLDALLPYTVATMQGPPLIFPPDWPEDSVHVCAEDDRPLDVARKFRVNLERLVRMNRKTYQGLTKVSPLKAGTALKLPLPMDIQIGDDPPPPPDPMRVGLVLVHYVGGMGDETEWVYTCSKRMRLSADKLWNAVAVEAAQEMENLLAPDPGAWKNHGKKVLKRVKKHSSSWPFWEPFWSESGEDDLEAPDYLQVIQEPMCLDMVEANLEGERYGSPDDFALHMRLIFNNAMHYNPPEHEYFKLAGKMLAVFEDAWSKGHPGNNWGQEFGKSVSLDMLKDTDKIRPSSSKKKGGSKLASTPAGKDGKDGDDADRIKVTRTPKTIMEVKLVKETKELLANFLEKFMAHEEAKYFRTAVTPDIAPDYLDVIKHPMDLGLVKEKLQENKYSISKTFVRDIRLVLENALAYNGKADQVHKDALKLQKKFEKAWKDVEGQLEEWLAEKQAKEEEKERRRAGDGAMDEEGTPDGKIDSAGGASSKKKVKIEEASTKFVWEEKGGWKKACGEILEKLLGREEAWPFEEPVDPKALQLDDYTKIIKSPMDLGTVKKKLEDDRYDQRKMGDEFYKDVMLTFDNALLYNDEEDEIWKHANTLKTLFRGMWKEITRPLKAAPTTASDKPKTPRPKAVHKGGWECEICDDGGKLILCDNCGRGWHAKCLEVDSVRQLPDPWYCRECPGGPKFLWQQKGGWPVVCKEIIGKLLKNKRAWPFEVPVDVKALKLGDYKKKIKKPMDLGTIKTKLDEGKYADLEQSADAEDFYNDVILTFDNALVYNNEGDEIWEHAAALKGIFGEMWTKVKSKLERLKKVVVETKPPGGTKVETGADPSSDVCKTPASAVTGVQGSSSKKKAHSEEPAVIYAWEKKGGWEVCCKEILDKLLKSKRAWPFAEPVDAKALGLKDYRKIVKKPMDLGTVGSKLEQGGYTELEKSGEEFYHDVMLTFDNALLYNNEGDEIWEHAASLKATTEELWAKLLKPVAPKAPVTPAPDVVAGMIKADPKTPASTGSKAAKGSKAKETDIGEAQDEHDPNHKGGWECEICDDGGKLILCDNCGRGWHAKCMQVSDVKHLPDPWYCRECPGGPKFLWQQKGGWHVVCKELLDMLFKDKRTWPFQRPVNPEDFGLDDYFKIIKKPMDLGTIDKRLRAGEYSHHKIHLEFYKDVSLVFDNAIKYNPKDDQFHELALELKTMFEDAWLQNKAVLPLNCALNSNLKKTPASKARSALLKAEAAAGASNTSRSSGTKKAATPAAELPAAESPRVSFEKKDKVAVCSKDILAWEKKGGWEVCCKEILDKLLKSKRAWPFAEPVDAKALGLKDYRKIVKKPMDLGTVGSKLEQGGYTELEKSGEEFYHDVMLTFDNALLYNNEGDEIWEHAASLKATTEELWAKLLEPSKGGGRHAVDSRAQAASAAGSGGGMYMRGKKGAQGDSKDDAGAATAPETAVPAHMGEADLKAVVQVACHVSRSRLLQSRVAVAVGRGLAVVQPMPAHSLSALHIAQGQEFVLGTYVRMLFDDGVWYPGVLTKFDARSKKYTVEFEDGEVQETRIPDKDVQVVPEKSANKKSSAKRRQAWADAGAGDSLNEAVGKAESATKAQPLSAAKTPAGDDLKPGQDWPIGTLVRMLFDDGAWYSGHITRFDARSKKYTVEFEDGDAQETKIPDKDVEVVEERGNRSRKKEKTEGSGGSKKRRTFDDPGAEEASGQLVQHLARPGTSAAKGQGLGGSSVASASAAEASEDRSAGGKRKRLSETPGMEEGLHDDPDANVGRAVSCHSASSGTTSQGMIVRYQARQGKYRIRLDDGKELDMALPDPAVDLLPTGSESAKATVSSKRASR